MAFADSTHRRYWLFDEAKLTEMRQQCHARAVAAVVSATAMYSGQGQGAQDGEDGGHGGVALPALPVPGVVPVSAEECLNLEEEEALVRYYEYQLDGVCRKVQVPGKVRWTAVMYYRRFYLAHSAMEYHPKEVMLTCVILSAKVEDVVIDIPRFCATFKADIEIVLELEIIVLEAIRFHLVIFHPFGAIEGFLALIRGLDSSIPLTKLRKEATRWAETAVHTDATLQYSPSQIALACLRLPAAKCDVNIDAFIQAKFADSAEVMATSAASIAMPTTTTTTATTTATATATGDIGTEDAGVVASGAEAMAQLQEALARIQSILEAGKKRGKPDKKGAALKSASRKLRKCRHPELHHKSPVFLAIRQARAQAKQQRELERARRQKAKQAAREAALLA